MSAIYIQGIGAVSPAGWSVSSFRDALAKGRLLASQEIAHPRWDKPLRVMRVPAPLPRPSFFGHTRLRRASPITQFAVSAALEALGPRPPETTRKIGVIVSIFSGCVNYSRRFYDETLKDPATASPLVFPETVFNAPASHIAAILGSAAINYTLVGDTGTFLAACVTGAEWIQDGKVEECLVVGTEEIDWLTAEALRLFDRSKTLSEGAGAVLLSSKPTSALARLQTVTDEFLYSQPGGKKNALAGMRKQLAGPGARTLLCDSTSNHAGISKDETLLWKDWHGPRLAPKRVLGEGLMASAAWQTVAAVDSLAQRTADSALVSIAGFHQHALGCAFTAAESDL